MKKIACYHTANINSIRVWGIVIFIYLASFYVYGQSRINYAETIRAYRSEIEHWLLPTSSDVTQTPYLAAFLVHPELDPDYSVCLKDSAKQFFIELRLLDKNLWHELFSRVIQKQSLILSFKTSIYSNSVSKRFKKKILAAFDKISPDKLPPANYDGISYSVFTVKNGEMKNVHISHELKAESYESEFIKLLTQISSDLKNNSFKESNYMDKFK